MVNRELINKIVRHYLKYDRDNPFIFISMLLAFLGISAGVMVLMIAMGIMNGTEQEFRKRLFVMNYPITLIPSITGTTNEQLLLQLSKEFPDLKFSPYYTTQVITKSGSNVNGSMLYGVDFKREMEINNIFKKALDGAIRIDSKYKMIIGEALAKNLLVRIGDKLILYFSEQRAVGFSTMPLQKRFKIIAEFDSGLTSYDKAIIYTTLEAFEKLLKRRRGVYDGIHIYSDNPIEDAKDIRRFLRKAGLGNSIVLEGWWEQNKSFFSAMEMEKRALFLVLLLIILVASLNIISSLLMTVMSRRSEIALLRTLGATKKEIKSIFFKVGVIVGIAGIIAGTILGFIGIWVLSTFDIISLARDVYGFTKLPVDLKIVDFISIIVGTFIIVLLSSLYPAKKASSTNPLKVLRNE